MPTRFLPIALILAGSATPALAQDSHYWTQVFGSRSGLLGGSNMAAPDDTSATFYNPGAIGFQRPGTLGVSANAYQVQLFDIEAGAGEGLDFSSDEINVIPLAIAGTLGWDALPDDVFGYSVITRNQSSFNASARLEGQADLLPELPGDEAFASQVFSRADVTEFWAGLSWGRKLHEHIAVGATFFGSLRDQSRGRSARLLATGADQAASSTLQEEVSYTNVRGLFKMGLSGSWELVDVGVTVTTPSFGIYGDGEVSGELSGLAAIEGNTRSLILADRESGLDASFRSPTSVAFGVEVRPIERVRVAGSFEWFDGVDEYDVVEGPPPDEAIADLPEGVDPGEDFLTVTDSARSVINFGFGLSVDVTEEIAGYASYRMDRSYKEREAASDFTLGIGNWDIQHVVLGGTYQLESSQLAVGLQYSWGDASTEQFVDASTSEDPIGGSILFAPGGRVDGDFQAVTALVGYTYFFE